MRGLGSKVSVLGLGKSGLQSALFLKANSFDVFVSESQPIQGFEQETQLLKEKNIAYEFGSHDLERIKKSDWVLVSPGIPPHAEVIKTLIKNQIPIYSEIEIASRFSKSKKVIAVTGTSGKTTVVTLLGRLLEEAYGKDRVVVCGNIGDPWIGHLDQVDEETFIVLEVSSFQLKYCESFQPWIGVLLNLSPNHLNWHRDMQDYAASKLKLFENQTSDQFAVGLKKDFEKWKIKDQTKASLIFLEESMEKNINFSALLTVAERCGILGEAAQKVWQEFEGIEHRLEKVGEFRGVLFVNDSKCTTRAALEWALASFEDRRVLLIAGGKVKSYDFEGAQKIIKRKVKKVFVLGEAKEILNKSWRSVCEVVEMDSLKDAFEAAVLKSEEGDVVLFSPACASFDMFKNYQDRGRAFKEIFNQWKDKQIRSYV